MFGQSGQGLSSARASGGRGSSSNWCTDRAPWRCAVPRQSAPVSPPPMITTRLPAAEMISSSGASSPGAAAVLLREVVDGEVDARELAAGHRQIARRRRAAAEHDGVEVAAQGVDRHVHADVDAGRKTTPSCSISSRRRSRWRFSSLNSGMP